MSLKNVPPISVKHLSNIEQGVFLCRTMNSADMLKGSSSRNLRNAPKDTCDLQANLRVSWRINPE